MKSLFARPAIVMVAALFIAMFASAFKSDKSDVVTKTFELDPFTSIALNLPIDVKIIEGDVQHVEITGSETAVEAINKKVKGGEWQISSSLNNYKKKDGVKIVITSNDIQALTLSGPGRIVSDHLLPLSAVTLSGSGRIKAMTSANQVANTLSGSGSIILSGDTNVCKVNIAGSGTFEGLGLTTNSATVSVSGSGKVGLHVTSSLNASISGSGSVRYKGSPSVDKSIFGSGKVVGLD